MKTQVGIIGAGPAGLLLARMLQNEGIQTVIIEHRSREYALSRIRAGVMEPGAVATFIQQGVGERLKREGMPHEEMQLRWNGEVHRFNQIDEDGRYLTTYGQSEIVRDMIEAREADGLPILWEAKAERLEGLADAPVIHFTRDGIQKTLSCDFIAGCDGFHGISRQHIPDVENASFLKEYPFAWLGILVEAPPNPDKRGYAHTPHGMAVASARSPSVGRLYIQVSPNETIDRWSEDAIWEELDRRFADDTGAMLCRGPIISKDIARLRAFICERMQHQRLFIAGDAAHIVPPSGAKGLNLAVGDVRVMAEAIRRNLKTGGTALIEDYSAICLRRIRAMVHWANRLAETLHIFPGQTAFDTKMQVETFNKWAYTEIGNREFVSSALGLPYEI